MLNLTQKMNSSCRKWWQWWKSVLQINEQQENGRNISDLRLVGNRKDYSKWT